MTPTQVSDALNILIVSEEEQALLLRVLEQAIRARRADTYRTAARTCRELVDREAILLEGLVDMLRQP